MKISKSQIKYLRGLAQSLSPVVMLGKDGLSDAVIAELKRALGDHELVKVKIQEEEKADFTALADELAVKVKSTLVQKIWRMAVYYTQNSNAEKRKIRLPKS